MSRAPSIAEFKEDQWPRLRARLPAEKVVLFGSQLHGGRDEESDLDLIIVSSRFEGLDTMARYSLVRDILKPDYSIDIFYYTPEEFQNALAERGIIAEAVREGVLLEAKREEENLAFNLFERRWQEMTGETLQILGRPDPPDFLCREVPSGREVAVEVTSIFLEPSTSEGQKQIAWERFLVHELRASLRGALPGTFILRFRHQDRPQAWNREQTLEEMCEAIASYAPSLEEGQEVEVSEPVKFRLYKLSQTGSKAFIGGLAKVYGLSARSFAGVVEPLLEKKNLRLKQQKGKGHATALLIVDRATTSIAEEEFFGSRELIDPNSYCNLDYIFLVRLHTKEVIQFLPIE